MNIKIYDIDRDTDGEDVELPIEIILHTTFDKNKVSDEWLSDYLSDYLSDTFGWCHNGFKFDEV